MRRGLCSLGHPFRKGKMGQKLSGFSLAVFPSDGKLSGDQTPYFLDETRESCYKSRFCLVVSRTM